MEYLPSVQSLLVAVLSFVAGFMYRKVSDHEQIADAFEEGFEKGAHTVAKTVGEQLGININLDITDEDE